MLIKQTEDCTTDKLKMLFQRQRVFLVSCASNVVPLFGDTCAKRKPFIVWTVQFGRGPC